MFVQFMAGVVTLVLGGWVGYVLSDKIAPPKHVRGLFAWGLAVLIAENIGRSTRLFSLFGFTIHLNYFLMSLVLGILLGMMVRRR